VFFDCVSDSEIVGGVVDDLEALNVVDAEGEEERVVVSVVLAEADSDADGVELRDELRDPVGDAVWLTVTEADALATTEPEADGTSLFVPERVVLGDGDTESVRLLVPVKHPG
jgi:hypothetical protein